ncbi:MAG TPA: alpha/beta hydrolase-fold protein [Thermoguttaceae bacterium]|nr:alpha/beta hydrolase-fold protein [Thermoguttaceae bacterium]
MRQTKLSVAPSRSSSDSTLHIQSALFSPSSFDTTCALFAPLHYEAGYAYPLIVWLHGRGDDERQLMRVMPLVSTRNYVAVAPRGFYVEAAEDSETSGYGWEQSEEAIERAEQQVFDSITVAQRKLHVSRRRVFLAGFDCGGTMAFRLALRHPRHFSGVLSLCGSFPGGYAPLGHLVEARQLQVFLAVGRDSRDYPPQKVCEDLRLFHAAGFSTTLRQYPCDHQLSPQMLSDVDRWIIEQITCPQDGCDQC